jgi:hypothetical protein
MTPRLPWGRGIYLEDAIVGVIFDADDMLRASKSSRALSEQTQTEYESGQAADNVFLGIHCSFLLV